MVTCCTCCTYGNLWALTARPQTPKLIYERAALVRLPTKLMLQISRISVRQSWQLCDAEVVVVVVRWMDDTWHCQGSPNNGC